MASICKEAIELSDRSSAVLDWLVNVSEPPTNGRCCKRKPAHIQHSQPSPKRLRKPLVDIRPELAHNMAPRTPRQPQRPATRSTRQESPTKGPAQNQPTTPDINNVTPRPLFNQPKIPILEKSLSESDMDKSSQSSRRSHSPTKMSELEGLEASLPFKCLLSVDQVTGAHPLRGYKDLLDQLADFADGEGIVPEEMKIQRSQ